MNIIFLIRSGYVDVFVIIGNVSINENFFVGGENESFNIFGSV